MCSPMMWVLASTIRPLSRRLPHPRGALPAPLAGEEEPAASPMGQPPGGSRPQAGSKSLGHLVDSVLREPRRTEAGSWPPHKEGLDSRCPPSAARETEKNAKVLLSTSLGLCFRDRESFFRLGSLSRVGRNGRSGRGIQSPISAVLGE